MIRLDVTRLEQTGFFAVVPAGTVRQLVADRRNLLITGSGGSGKTTALGALLGLADPSDWIVTIEDVAELRVDHPHVVTLDSPDSPDSGPVKSPPRGQRDPYRHPPRARRVCAPHRPDREVRAQLA